MGKIEQINYKKVISTILITIIYTYLTLPFIIFIGGYCKLWIAVIAEIIILISLILAIKQTPDMWIPHFNKQTIFKLFVILLIIVNVVIASGIGGKVYQNTDHIFRNPMFQLLVDNNWPVVSGTAGGETRAIIYYTGFWLPSAVIGKMFGVEAGYNFQVLWGIIGIFLMYYLVCAWRKKICIWPLVVVLFFGGLDFIIVNLFSEIPTTIMALDHLEFVGYFSSMMTQLFWPYNQAIPSWLTIMLLWNLKSRKNLVFILSTLMISATFPFVGLIPFVIYFAVKNREYIVGKEESKGTRFVHFLKEICTFQNVIGAGVIGILSFLYLIGNGSGQKIDPINVKTITEFASSAGEGAGTGIFWALLRFSIVMMLEVGIYVMLIYKKQKSNPLFYIVTGCLVLMPFGQVGEAKDFCMRATIPALFILMLFLIEQLEERHYNFKYYILIGVLIIGGITGFHEIHRTLVQTENGFRFGDRDVLEIAGGGNFSGSVDNPFIRYFCKDYHTKKIESRVIEYTEDTLLDDVLVMGPEFSEEENAPMAEEIRLVFDGVAEGKIYFYNDGMLDDTSVTSTIYVNDMEVGTLDYENPEILIPQAYFTDYTQRIVVKMNKPVKLYAGDVFRIYKE